MISRQNKSCDQFLARGLVYIYPSFILVKREIDVKNVFFKKDVPKGAAQMTENGYLKIF